MKRQNTSDTSSENGHTCAICGKRVEADAPKFPFCSERCRKVDLNRWFGGSYRISRPARDDDELEEDRDGPGRDDS